MIFWCLNNKTISNYKKSTYGSFMCMLFDAYKENRKDPIVGLGLLLDANQIPIGMELFPGNESEKPILRNVIKKLKDKNQITGKTIHVADKGLNCAQNIAFSKENGDGYLFSKSVKSLPEKGKRQIPYT